MEGSHAGMFSSFDWSVIYSIGPTTWSSRVIKSRCKLSQVQLLCSGHCHLSGGTVNKWTQYTVITYIYMAPQIAFQTKDSQSVSFDRWSNNWTKVLTEKYTFNWTAHTVQVQLKWRQSIKIGTWLFQIGNCNWIICLNEFTDWTSGFQRSKTLKQIQNVSFLQVKNRKKRRNANLDCPPCKVFVFSLSSANATWENFSNVSWYFGPWVLGKE